MKFACAYIVAFFFAAFAATSAADAQVQYGNDPGRSGVIDGTDVYQFLDSGPRIDPVRMEEASRRFDNTIYMPTRQAKSWNEEIEREKSIKKGTRYYWKQSNEEYDRQHAQADPREHSAKTAHGTVRKDHHLKHSLTNGFLRAADFLGFPLTYDDLPGEVDASLASDLPYGPDPRLYVHEREKKSAPRASQQVETNPATTRSRSRMRTSYKQPPTIITE